MLVRAGLVQSTSEGAGWDTRGRVCSPTFYCVVTVSVGDPAIAILNPAEGGVNMLVLTFGLANQTRFTRVI
jgi:hypothetical protein